MSTETQVIGLQALRRDLSRVMGEIAYAKQRYVIESYGKPAAVLLSMTEFEQLVSAARPRADSPTVRVMSPRLVDPEDLASLLVELVAPADA